MSEERSEIARLGEFGLIGRIAGETVLSNPTTVKGIGDDAAVIDSGEQYTLLATDMLLEGNHFDLGYVPLRHLGYKAVAVNVSDIAAMNGTPGQVVVGLALSNRFSVEAVDELYDGMRAACRDFKVDLVGGDTTASPSGLVLSIAITGTCDKRKVAYRSGAKANDIICVTGDLGAAYMGLQVLEREKAVFQSNPESQPDLEQYQYVVGRPLKPSARMDIIHEFAERGLVTTSMIDVSDGLASELLHISKASGVGVKIFEDKVPVDHMTYETAVEFNIDPITCALNGGEDYELLFTIRQEDLDKVRQHPDIHLIGHIHNNASENVMITKSGNTVQLKAQGWTHF
ncbi:MAG: thiamine-phosphate kinase [Bacteroidota bacterium]